MFVGMFVFCAHCCCWLVVKKRWGEREREKEKEEKVKNRNSRARVSDLSACTAISNSKKQANEETDRQTDGKSMHSDSELASQLVSCPVSRQSAS